MTIRKTSILVALLLFVSLGYGQKFGYVNSGNLLENLPEVKEADAQLASYSEELKKEGQSSVANLEKKYSEYMTRVQSGELSRIQQEELEADLNKDQQALSTMEQEASNKIALKRNELISPILKRADELIQKVGKDEGYSMIFDSSIGSLLYAVEAENLTEKIRQMMVTQ